MCWQTVHVNDCLDQIYIITLCLNGLYAVKFDFSGWLIYLLLHCVPQHGRLVKRVKYVCLLFASFIVHNLSFSRPPPPTPHPSVALLLVLCILIVDFPWHKPYLHCFIFAVNKFQTYRTKMGARGSIKYCVGGSVKCCVPGIQAILSCDIVCSCWGNVCLRGIICSHIYCLIGVKKRQMLFIFNGCPSLLTSSVHVGAMYCVDLQCYNLCVHLLLGWNSL